MRYVGVLTDGQLWILHHLLLNDTLVEVDRSTLTTASEADLLAAWLEAVLATADQIVPTPCLASRNRRRLARWEWGDRVV